MGVGVRGVGVALEVGGGGIPVAVGIGEAVGAVVGDGVGDGVVRHMIG